MDAFAEPNLTEPDDGVSSEHPRVGGFCCKDQRTWQPCPRLGKKKKKKRVEIFAVRSVPQRRETTFWTSVLVKEGTRGGRLRGGTEF